MIDSNVTIANISKLSVHLFHKWVGTHVHVCTHTKQSRQEWVPMGAGQARDPWCQYFEYLISPLGLSQRRVCFVEPHALTFIVWRRYLNTIGPERWPIRKAFGNAFMCVYVRVSAWLGLIFHLLVFLKATCHSM